MTNHTVTIVFKGGAQVDLPAADKEVRDLMRQWETHLGDPNAQTQLNADYADTKGNMRLEASNVAGIFDQRE